MGDKADFLLVLPVANLELATSGFEVHYSIQLSYAGSSDSYYTPLKISGPHLDLVRLPLPFLGIVRIRLFPNLRKWNEVNQGLTSDRKFCLGG